VNRPPEPELQSTELGAPDFACWPGTVSTGLNLQLQLCQKPSLSAGAQSSVFLSISPTKRLGSMVTTEPDGLCPLAKIFQNKSLSIDLEDTGEELRKLLGQDLLTSCLLCEVIISSLKFINST